MFAKTISDMTLVNDIADRLFDNISGSNYSLDRTFTATMRAVLYERLPASETVNFALVPIGLDFNAIRLKSTNAIIKEISDSIQQHAFGNNYSISVVYAQDSHAGERLLDIVRANAGEGKQLLRDYTLWEDLRIFYIKKLSALFYTGDCSTVIFIDSMDIRKFHALQMMIPRYLPKLFANAPLSEDEARLLKSTGSRSHAEYEMLIEQFAQKLDMRNEIIRTRLKGFETIFERDRVQEVSSTLEIHRGDYQRLLENLGTTANIIREQEILLAGLQSVIEDSSDSELMEYFLCNKNLSIMRVKDTELDFVVHGYADSYDEEAFDTYAANPNSYLYSQTLTNITKPELERFYRAIFGEGLLKLRICAAYRANMKSGISAMSQYIFPPESQTYMPNPHIQNSGCTGSFAPRFVEYMNCRDYVGAIDLATISARNLNFHDSGVISSFVRTLASTPIRCIEDSDGNLMTPKQAIKKLEEVQGCQSP